tara:strand:+ start:3252 stop:3518 length:267 start_codon:yes stop_codon:yes gene_type:complete
MKLSHQRFFPEGWLIAPSGKWLILFHHDPMSLARCPQFYTDKWYATPNRTPLGFKNRRKAPLEESVETWNELIGNGWLRVNHQCGDVS